MGLVVRSSVQDHNQVSNLSAGEAPWGGIRGGRTGLQERLALSFEVAEPEVLWDIQV